MTYEIEFSNGARKALKALSPDAQARILQALAELAKAPLDAPNVKRLAGREGLRLRVGDYRILYVIEHDRLVVFVVHVAHRREVYR